MTKLLVIRFSSIGDILQCMPAVDLFGASFPGAEIHWLTRSDMAPLLAIDPRINRIWRFDRRGGLSTLLKTALTLRREAFTHIYDAHGNIRSAIVKLLLCAPSIGGARGGRRIVTRHKDRLKRLLLFNFRINLFPKPFRGAASYVEPLKRFGGFYAPALGSGPPAGYRFSPDVARVVDELLMPVKEYRWICLVPSAAWELKRWPAEYWKRLVTIMPDKRFVVIGGPKDTFCEEIARCAPDRIVNLAGKISLLETVYVVYAAPYVISGDTGFLHAADLFRKPGQALIGPTAFGFPANDTMKVTAVDLPCRPCTKYGKGKCRNRVWKRCMRDITPEMVKERVEEEFKPDLYMHDLNSA